MKIHITQLWYLSTVRSVNWCDWNPYWSIFTFFKKKEKEKKEMILPTMHIKTDL